VRPDAAVTRIVDHEPHAALPALQLLYDTAPIGLAFLTPDCRYLQINQRLTEICGISVADHLGRSVRETVPALADQVESWSRPSWRPACPSRASRSAGSGRMGPIVSGSPAGIPSRTRTASRSRQCGGGGDHRAQTRREALAASQARLASLPTI